MKKRYFIALDGRNWVFAVDTVERKTDGTPVWKRLARASNTKIRRHIKIRKEANSFDPLWRPSFEERVLRKKLGMSRLQAGGEPL